MSTTTNSLSTLPPAIRGRLSRDNVAPSPSFSQSAASLVVRVPSLANNTLTRSHSAQAFMYRFIRTRFFVTADTAHNPLPPNVK
jgi:hypothetical protein